MDEKKPGFFQRASKRVKIALVAALVLLLLLCCVGSLFLWYGGFVREVTCRVVRAESDIWKVMGCNNTGAIIDNSNQNSGSTDNVLQGLISEDDEARTIRIVDKTVDAVVGIGYVDDANQTQMVGSGFMVSKEGLIVTNLYVVADEGRKYIVVARNYDKPLSIDQKNIFRDPVNDIALIKTNNPQLLNGLVFLEIGQTAKLKSGQSVIAIGNPLGEYTSTVTKGIISGLGREVRIGSSFTLGSERVYQDVIQTDAAINPGNSGGPLLNLKGEVVGVNFATVFGAENISFAIPINRVEMRIQELATFGKLRLPFLGMDYKTKIVYIKGEATLGASITDIVKNSPAEKAKLQNGDVILTFNGIDLNDKSLLTLIQESKIGDHVMLTILREKATLEIVISIGEE